LLLVQIFAQVTIFDYQNIPPWGTTSVGCLFNQPGPPFQVAGFSHYAVSGGVFYTGSELRLQNTQSGDGTAFGIYYHFKVGSTYKIEVEAKQNLLGGSSAIRFTINNAQTHASTNCTPEYMQYITSGAAYSTIIAPSQSPNLTTSYQNFIIANNYAPTYNNLNYFLIGSFQVAPGNGADGYAYIRKIIITETPPPCNLPAANNLTSNSSGSLRWDAIPGASSYNVILTSSNGGGSSTVTIPTSQNYYEYCGVNGNNISFKVQGVCSNGGLGLISNPYTFVYSLPSGTATNLTGTLAYPYGPNSYYGYYINFTPVPGVTNYAMEWFDVTTNSLMSTYYINYTGTNSVFYYYFLSGHIYKYRLAVQTPCGLGIYSNWSPLLMPPVVTASCANGPISSTLSYSIGCGSGTMGCPYTNLYWPAIPSASQYTIEYIVFNTSSGMSYPTYTTTTPASSGTVYKTVGLPYLSGVGWNIKYRVAANCGGTLGNFSNWSPTFFLQ
ncbi:MAG: hypothetical protein ACQUYJ_16185, partial [Ferruginibacter sp.]